MKTNNKPEEKTDISEYIANIKRKHQNKIDLMYVIVILYIIIMLIYGVNVIKDIFEYGFNKYNIANLLELTAITMAIFILYDSIKYYKKIDYTVPTLQLLKNLRKNKKWTPKRVASIIIFIALFKATAFFIPHINYRKILIEYSIFFVVFVLIDYFFTKPKRDKLSKLIKELEEE